MKSAALLIGLLFAAEPSDRLIGYVGQQAIHESQVTGTDEREREASLRRLFIGPAIKAYLEPFRSQWQLTEGEIQELILAYKKSQPCLPPPPGPTSPDFERMFAKFLGEKTKIERFIYEHNGGGRMLFQQAGTEAFDATLNLILKLEKEGAFTIADPKLRTQALKYWLSDHQADDLLPDPGADRAFTLGALIDTLTSRCSRD
jgi:hypothetical protein